MCAICRRSTQILQFPCTASYCGGSSSTQLPPTTQTLTAWRETPSVCRWAFAPFSSTEELQFTTTKVEPSEQSLFYKFISFLKVGFKNNTRQCHTSCSPNISGKSFPPHWQVNVGTLIENKWLRTLFSHPAYFTNTFDYIQRQYNLTYYSIIWLK